MSGRSMRCTSSGIKVATPDEAKLLVHAVVLGLLPKIQWRLSAEERRDIRPGDVFVWQDHAANADSGGASLERWTDGRHWGPSRMRDEFLFYYERENENDDLGYTRDPGTSRMISVDPSRYMQRDQMPTGPRAPALPLNANGALNPNRLIKQAYSVVVLTGGQPSKWHMTTYFTKASLAKLRSVREHPQLRALSVPEGQYIFFKSYKAQLASRTLPHQQPQQPATPALPGLASVITTPLHTARSPPPGPVSRYATPGLPSPTDLLPKGYPRRLPEDQRAIQAFQRYSPPRVEP